MRTQVQGFIIERSRFHKLINCISFVFVTLFFFVIPLLSREYKVEEEHFNSTGSRSGIYVGTKECAYSISP